MFNSTSSKVPRTLIFIAFGLILLILVGEGAYLLGHKQGKSSQEKVAQETVKEETAPAAELGVRREGLGVVTKEGTYYGNVEGKIVKIDGRRLTLEAEMPEGQEGQGETQELVINISADGHLLEFSGPGSEPKITIMKDEIDHYLSVGQSVTVAGLRTDENGLLIGDEIGVFLLE